MFQDMLAGQGSNLAMAIGVVALALVALFLVFWFMRSRSTSTFIRGGRNRQPRLAVLDAAAVDTRRRLVLVRRDDVEHLIMIGGPTDLVIESRIIPAEASGLRDAMPVPVPEPAAMRPPQPARPQPRPEPRQEPKAEAEAHKADPETPPAPPPAEAPRREPPRQSERPVMVAARTELSAMPVAAPVAAQAQPAPPAASGPPVATNVSTPASPISGTPADAPQRPPSSEPAAPPRKAAQSAHSFATTTPFASRATPAWIPQTPKPVADRAPRTESAPQSDSTDVRETAMDALDAARARVLPAAAPQPTPAPASAPVRTAEPESGPAGKAADEPTIDYNIMEAAGEDFQSILEAELSSDLSDLDLGSPRPLPQPQTNPDQSADKSKSRDELQEEMERLLGDLSIRP